MSTRLVSMEAIIFFGTINMWEMHLAYLHGTGLSSSAEHSEATELSPPAPDKKQVSYVQKISRMSSIPILFLFFPSP